MQVAKMVRPSGHLLVSCEPSPEDWSRVRWASLDPRHGRLRMERILHHIPRGGRHLDVGTGNGDGTLLAAQKTWCVGLEYGPTSAGFAAEKGLRVTQGDGRRMPFRSAAFDSVSCLDVLEHIPHPIRALQEMARVLRPGGKLILQTPHAELFKERLLRFVRSLGYRQLQPYDVPLRLAEIRSSLWASGLAVEREKELRCWDENPIIRWISWSRLFLCRKLG